MDLLEAIEKQKEIEEEVKRGYANRPECPGLFSDAITMARAERMYSAWYGAQFYKALRECYFDIERYADDLMLRGKVFEAAKVRRIARKAKKALDIGLK